jgi:hypothetical protein
MVVDLVRRIKSKANQAGAIHIAYILLGVMGIGLWDQSLAIKSIVEHFPFVESLTSRCGRTDSVPHPVTGNLLPSHTLVTSPNEHRLHEEVTM